MRLKVSRARSGLHGGGVGSDGAVRTSSLDRSCEAQWAESLQECRERGEQEPRVRRMAHMISRPIPPAGLVAGAGPCPVPGQGRPGPLRLRSRSRAMMRPGRGSGSA
ncbi:hypothetical protein MRA01_24020 [Methylobacterium radiotolerans]|nr:hypothetical protein MRA01_24020 [Methylobacterium radiotolerans]